MSLARPRPRRGPAHAKKHYLVASDFDKTLSFNDSGYVLAELLAVPDFEKKVAAVSQLNMIQQGGELAYLLVHDPDFRCVRREHLVETGHRIDLKHSIREFLRVLAEGIDDVRFSFFVISAAPEEVIQSALEGIVPADHIYGTRFAYHPDSGEIASVTRVAAGYGKVAVLGEIQAKLEVGDERVIYSGDGSSDVHVMLHIGQRQGYTIAVSQAVYLTQIAKRTVLSDDAFAVLIPILEDICGWDASRIRQFCEAQDLLVHEWAKMRTDWLTLRRSRAEAGAGGRPAEGQGTT